MAQYSCRIEAPARLHLGFIDLSGDLGRLFGSLGLAITGFDTVVSAAPDRQLVVTGAETARARDFARQVLEALGAAHAVRLEVTHAAPPHIGLGSGTQLALAVAAAVSGALGFDSDPRALARRVGRGERSGIGLAAFAGGGFVVDGGRGPQTGLPPAISRLDFPPEWRAVLVFDPGYDGLHGTAEREAFAALPPMPATVADRLARHCLVGLLPAIAERDFSAFCTHLQAIQQAVGAHFAPAQGGAIVSPRVAAALRLASRAFGLTGSGQTSWGPTGFVFTPDMMSAERFVEALAREPEAAGTTTTIVEACNHGAVMSRATAARWATLRTP